MTEIVDVEVPFAETLVGFAVITGTNLKTRFSSNVTMTLRFESVATPIGAVKFIRPLA